MTDHPSPLPHVFADGQAFAASGERAGGVSDPGTNVTAESGGKPRKVILLASAGGHWIELCRLSPAFAGCDCLFVSTASGMIAPVGEREVLQVVDSSRDTAWTMLRTFLHILPIIRDFRPDIVLSTGAAPGALGMIIAKFYGARTIWVDSIANSDVLSLSGQLVKMVADLRLTQWPHLADERRKLYYFGKIL